MSGGMKAKLDSWSKQYTQDADCCDGSNLQILDVSQHDGGGGPFFALKTDRWAFDSIAEVYVLLRVAFLEGLRWHDLGLRNHLARVHVFAPRLPMMHRAGWEGPVNSNSGMAFGWYSFQRDWARKSGRPTIDWFNWKKDLP